MLSAAMRFFRPDFRTIFKNLCYSEKEIIAQTMDATYDIITKTVDDETLDETHTALLVNKYVEKVQESEKCFEVIMGAIWPAPRKQCYIILDSSEVTDPVSPSNPKLGDLVEEVEHTLGVRATDGVNEVETRKVFEVIDSNSSITMDDDRLVISKRGWTIPLVGKLHELPVVQAGGSDHAKQDSVANPSDESTDVEPANNAMQPPSTGGPSTAYPTVSGPPSSHSYWVQPPNSSFSLPQHSQSSGTGHHRGFGSLLGRAAPRGQPASRGRGRGAPRGRGSGSPTNPGSNYHFTQNISYYPMLGGRELKRTHAFTELSPPGAETIVLGPMPPPTLPSRIRVSTVPPGHPPQSYGPGAFPSHFNIPGASSSNSSSGAISSGIEEVASAPTVQPVASAQTLGSSEISRKRSRTDWDEEEETTRPSTRLRIEAPPQSSLPDDTTGATALGAFPPTPAPSGNSDSSDNHSTKKRVRDDREDEEAIARPSSRTRREPPAPRPRYPSPTPSDRRIGRIIAPFGTSTRFNPRPSPEADIGSLGAARVEGNPPDNLPASSSGSSILPLVSSDATPASRSSQRIRQQKAKDVSKKE